MKYKFHPDALEEYREAAIWYANREQELAQQFIASIEDTVHKVVETPNRWRIIDEDVRRCIAHLFRTQFSTRSKTSSYLSLR